MYKINDDLTNLLLRVKSFEFQMPVIYPIVKYLNREVNNSEISPLLDLRNRNDCFDYIKKRNKEIEACKESILKSFPEYPDLLYRLEKTYIEFLNSQE